MYDFFHRRPGKRHFLAGLVLVAAVMLWAGWYTRTGEQSMAVDACVRRALVAFRRSGVKADAPAAATAAPGTGRSARAVARDLCAADPGAF